MKKCVFIILIVFFTQGCVMVDTFSTMMATAVDPLHNLTQQERQHVENNIRRLENDPEFQRLHRLKSPPNEGDVVGFVVVDRLSNGYSANFIVVRWENKKFAIRRARRVFSEDPEVIVHEIHMNTGISKPRVRQMHRKQLEPVIHNHVRKTRHEFPC